MKDPQLAIHGLRPRSRALKGDVLGFRDLPSGVAAELSRDVNLPTLDRVDGRSPGEAKLLGDTLVQTQSGKP